MSFEKTERRRVRWGREKKIQVIGRVDVESQAGELENLGSEAELARAGEMRREARLAEAKRERGGRRHEDRVRPLSVARRSENDGRWGAERAEHRCELFGSRGGQIARDAEHRRHAAPFELAHRARHRSRVPLVRGLLEDLGAEAGRPLHDLGLVGDDEKPGESGDAREGAEHVVQHRKREQLARRRGESFGQTLLGRAEILEGDDRRRQSASSTARASATSPSRPSMTMSARIGAMPRSRSASTQAASCRSTKSASRNPRYPSATPTADTSKPLARIILPAGPLSGALPTMGLMATTLARVSRRAARSSCTASIGPIELIGFEGQTTIASARWIPSTTPGAARAPVAPS